MPILCLGYLDADFFLGGAMRLDRERAADAIRRHVAEPLRLDPTRAAWGIHAMVNDNMARAAKVHCLERGKDPRDYVLLAYGGAGPVHAAQVAAALGIKRVMYPLRAGVMSALGFLAAPVAFERMRADVGPLDAVDLARANAILAELAAEARELVRAAGVPAAACVVKREAALRFAGQSYALPVPLPAGRLTRAHLQQLRADFVALYRKRYYRLNPDVPVELVNWRVSVAGPKPELHIAPIEPGTRTARKGTRPVYFSEAGRYVDCAVYDRFALGSGQAFARTRGDRGAGIDRGDRPRKLVPPIDRDGNLMVTLASAGAASGRRHERGGQPRPAGRIDARCARPTHCDQSGTPRRPQHDASEVLGAFVAALQTDASSPHWWPRRRTICSTPSVWPAPD